MLSRHFRTISKFVKESHQQVCIEMEPVIVKDYIKMYFSSRKVVSLEHKGTQEYSCIRIDCASIASNLLVDTLLCFYLKSISQRKLSKLSPFLAIIWVLYQMVYVIFLCIFDISDSVKFLSKSRVLFSCRFLDTFMDFVKS